MQLDKRQGIEDTTANRTSANGATSAELGQ